jgi:hypothetical protein
MCLPSKSLWRNVLANRHETGGMQTATQVSTDGTQRLAVARTGGDTVGTAAGSASCGAGAEKRGPRVPACPAVTSGWP